MDLQDGDEDAGDMSERDDQEELEEMDKIAKQAEHDLTLLSPPGAASSKSLDTRIVNRFFTGFQEKILVRNCTRFPVHLVVFPGDGYVLKEGSFSVALHPDGVSLSLDFKREKDESDKTQYTIMPLNVSPLGTKPSWTELYLGKDHCTITLLRHSPLLKSVFTYQKNRRVPVGSKFSILTKHIMKGAITHTFSAGKKQ